jgi:hypothetical protein
MLHAASLELRACLAAVLGAEDEVLTGYRLHAKAILPVRGLLTEIALGVDVEGR